LHARRAEQMACAVATNGSGADEQAGTSCAGGAGESLQQGFFTEAQYALWLQVAECCDEAATLSEGQLGHREGAFAHLRVGVHLSVRVPTQAQLLNSKRQETLAELADRHFGKALRAFDELKDAREVAVCHFHMADLLLREQCMPGVASPARSRIIAALRHARRSGEYWELVGALQYAKDFIASHVRTARLLELQNRGNALIEALQHLSEREAVLIGLANGSNVETSVELFTLDGRGDSKRRLVVAVPAFRREMGRLCQAGLRQGEDVERLKAVYRRVLRNEPLALNGLPAG